MKWGNIVLIFLLIFALVFSFVPLARAYTISPVYPQSSLFGSGVYRYYAGGIYFYAGDDPASSTSNGTGLALYHLYVYDITTSTLVCNVNFTGTGIVQSWRSNGIITRWLLCPYGYSWVAQHSYTVGVSAFVGTPTGNGYGVSGSWYAVVSNLQVGGGYYALGEYNPWTPTTSAQANSFSCQLKTVVINISTNFDSVSSCDFVNTSEVLSHSFSGSQSSYGYLTLVFASDVSDDTYNYNYTVHGLKDGQAVQASSDFSVLVACNTPVQSDIQYKVIVQPNKQDLAGLPRSSVLYLYKSIDKGVSWVLLNVSYYTLDVSVHTVVDDPDADLVWFSLGGNAYRIESTVNGGSDLYQYYVGVDSKVLTGTFYMSGSPEDVITNIYDDGGNPISQVSGLQGIAEAIYKAITALADKIKAVLNYLFVPTLDQVKSLLPSALMEDMGLSPLTQAMFGTAVYTFNLPYGTGVGQYFALVIEDNTAFTLLRGALQVLLSALLIYTIILSV